VYRVNPQTMGASEALRIDDHIGAVAYDTDDDTLHAASWGSRRFYRWKVERGRVRGTAQMPRPRSNPSHYVDYQDCKYAGNHRALCTGVTELRVTENGTPFRLGGMDLIDLRDGRPLHQAPVLLWTTTGLDMTHNPVWVEPAPTGVRAYFMPEDDTSTLYIYETESPAALCTPSPPRSNDQPHALAHGPSFCAARRTTRVLRSPKSPTASASS
jgi:hypothetical protein